MDNTIRLFLLWCQQVEANNLSVSDLQWLITHMRNRMWTNITFANHRILVNKAAKHLKKLRWLDVDHQLKKSALWLHFQKILSVLWPARAQLPVCFDSLLVRDRLRKIWYVSEDWKVLTHISDSLTHNKAAKHLKKLRWLDVDHQLKKSALWLHFQKILSVLWPARAQLPVCFDSLLVRDRLRKIWYVSEDWKVSNVAACPMLEVGHFRLAVTDKNATRIHWCVEWWMTLSINTDWTEDMGVTYTGTLNRVSAERVRDPV